MAIDPTPLNQIRKPVYTTVNIKDVVESLDPTRHEETVEYEFSNSRKFKRVPYYEPLPDTVFGGDRVTFGGDEDVNW